MQATKSLVWVALSGLIACKQGDVHTADHAELRTGTTAARSEIVQNTATTPDKPTDHSTHTDETGEVPKKVTTAGGQELNVYSDHIEVVSGGGGGQATGVTIQLTGETAVAKTAPAAPDKTGRSTSSAPSASPIPSVAGLAGTQEGVVPAHADISNAQVPVVTTAPVEEVAPVVTPLEEAAPLVVALAELPDVQLAPDTAYTLTLDQSTPAPSPVVVTIVTLAAAPSVESAALQGDGRFIIKIGTQNNPAATRYAIAVISEISGEVLGFVNVATGQFLTKDHEAERFGVFAPGAIDADGIVELVVLGVPAPWDHLAFIVQAKNSADEATAWSSPEVAPEAPVASAEPDQVVPVTPVGTISTVDSASPAPQDDGAWRRARIKDLRQQMAEIRKERQATDKTRRFLLKDLRALEKGSKGSLTELATKQAAINVQLEIKEKLVKRLAELRAELAALKGVGKGDEGRQEREDKKAAKQAEKAQKRADKAAAKATKKAAKEAEKAAKAEVKAEKVEAKEEAKAEKVEVKAEAKAEKVEAKEEAKATKAKK